MGFVTAGCQVQVDCVDGRAAAPDEVGEVVVVGRTDEVRDEVPVTFVVAANPVAPPSVAELQTWCAERLTKAKRPATSPSSTRSPAPALARSVRSFSATPRPNP